MLCCQQLTTDWLNIRTLLQVLNVLMSELKKLNIGSGILTCTHTVFSLSIVVCYY